MSLTKITYTNRITVIPAENLNDIQDAVIDNTANIELHSTKLTQLQYTAITNAEIESLFN